MIADYVSGEPMILEPHKCAEWKWYGWNSAPEPLFLTSKNLAENQIDLRNFL